MLDFKNGIQFLGLLLILATCVICINFACNHQQKEVISHTVVKTDTIIKYVYGAGKTKKIIHKVMYPGDTVTLVDTAIIYRDTNLSLMVENLKADTPTITYRIKETTIRDTILIDPGKEYNTFNLGLMSSTSSLTPSISYNTSNCNYLIGYDVINKSPSFGILVKFANIARPKLKGRRSVSYTHLTLPTKA